MGESIDLEVVKPVSQSYLTQLWNNDAFTKEKDISFEMLINKVSKYFTIVVLVLSLIGFAFWFAKLAIDWTGFPVGNALGSVDGPAWWWDQFHTKEGTGVTMGGWLVVFAWRASVFSVNAR